MKNSKGLANELAYLASQTGPEFWKDSNYRNYRSQLWSYQKENNISSVYWEEVTFLDEKICFPNYSSELLFMPQDHGILQRQKSKTIEKFLSFQARHGLFMTDAYELASPDYVRDFCDKYDHATLGVTEHRPDFVLTKYSGEIATERIKGVFYSRYYLFLESLPPMPVEEREQLEDHGASFMDGITLIREVQAYLPEYC
ncbi:hypothetical protein [Synechocystis salina]|uniref:Uncharacterized protein n=1 Tax=Synechocystis salina LEGE 00031 TaxID=1828736 RepID=A0ABR9VWE5_9SYNC|nr:hypothetical protein [Synechocystis salina]MBE9242686.1 hypothetical protein [Synechocystis salina LEGE 00041]MBE9255689.1 hypothetical protein [Synechocystis salina LEGE 00031]